MATDTTRTRAALDATRHATVLTEVVVLSHPLWVKWAEWEKQLAQIAREMNDWIGANIEVVPVGE